MEPKKEVEARLPMPFPMGPSTVFFKFDDNK